MTANYHSLIPRPSSVFLAIATSKRLLHAQHSAIPPPHSGSRTLQARSFVSNPMTQDIQTLHASRTLSYHASALYKIISDIDSYSTFFPYCTSSTITKRSQPDKNGISWPQEAELRVGWGPYDEMFRSRVFCVPGVIVEAVVGEARSSIPNDDLRHHDADHYQPKASGNELFTSLLTRWTLKEFPFKPLPPDGKTPQEGNASEPAKPQTEVNLVIEAQFASAVYAALSKAAAPKVAGIMIQAFEKRVQEVLGRGHGGVNDYPKMRSEKSPSALDGIITGPGTAEAP